MKMAQDLSKREQQALSSKIQNLFRQGRAFVRLRSNPISIYLISILPPIAIKSLPSLKKDPHLCLKSRARLFVSRRLIVEPFSKKRKTLKISKQLAP
jgi:hypothetical protein